MDDGIGTAQVTDELPVQAGQGCEVQNTPAQLAEIGERTSGCSRVQVLQNVVADNNIERRTGLVRLDLCMLPAETLTEIFTGLDAGVGGPRQVAFQPGLEQPGPAPCIENS